MTASLAAILWTGAIGATMGPPSVAVLPVRGATLESAEALWFERAIVTAITEQTAHIAVGSADLESRLGPEARDLLSCAAAECLNEQAERLRLRYLVVAAASREGGGVWLELGVRVVRDNRAVRHRFVTIPAAAAVVPEIRRLVFEQLGPLPPVPDIAAFWQVAGVTPEPAALPREPDPLEGANLRVRAPVASVLTPPGYDPRAPRTAGLTVAVNAPDAVVWIDGSRVGPAPQTIPGAGSYYVEVEAPGHGDWVRLVEVAPGVDAELDVALTPMRRHAVGGAFLFRWGPWTEASLGVAEYRYRHFPWLASRVRAGGGAVNPRWPWRFWNQAAAFVSVGEQLILPLFGRNEPMATSENWPIELTLGGDVELLAFAYPSMTVLASAGARLWWITFSGSIGFAVEEMGVGLAGGLSMGALLTF